MFLAPRGLREEEDGTRVRMAEEWFVSVQRQAKRVWVQAAAAALVLTGAAVLYGFLRG